MNRSYFLMSSSSGSTILPSLCLLIMFAFAHVHMYPSTVISQPPQGLDYYYYDKSCPRLQMMVGFNVWAAVKNDTRMAASLLRLHFHDCIVNGCDASVLLDDTQNMKGEKNALPNRNSIRGFEVIDSIKADVEKFCPSTVSCADILSLAAREAVSLAGGPFWQVPLGRRDATTASEKAAVDQIPAPIEPLQNIFKKFTSKGLDIKDVVVLSGTLRQTGPNTGFLLATKLAILVSKKDASNSTLAPLDSTSNDEFDNMYFTGLLNNNGLLESDQALLRDQRTSGLVNSYSAYPFLFSNDFAASMVKMGNLGVLTGQDGQIRKKCGSVNH
ncbi:hypothetical protein FNV43_RR22446 [Rhamnella rubrinervis]|uniref:Peroxidase n=1 Tax=Rhamnella rubrinervis TaxID=2594499 RepID=A0A8K0GN65_9ROSA|nr:hypothetical protein FNV43_RR22446 [Rhamnella rubrinervis]